MAATEHDVLACLGLVMICNRACGRFYALHLRRLYPVEFLRHGLRKIDAPCIAEIHESDEDVSSLVGNVRFIHILALPALLLEVSQLTGFAAEFETEELRRTSDEAMFLIGVEGLLHCGHSSDDSRLQGSPEIAGRHDRTSK